MAEVTDNPPSIVGPRRFPLILAALVLVSYWEIILGFGTLYLRDFLSFGYPLAHYHKHAILAGEIPLWNPLSECGVPFLAQWNTMVLYPGSLIYVLLPLPWSLNVFVVLHNLLGGIGMYFLARHWTRLDVAGALAAIAYCFQGLLQESLLWPNNMAAFGWLPWVLLAADRGCREGGRWTLIAVICGGLQMLTGAPEVIMVTWILAGLLVLPSADRDGLARFALIVVWVACLAAAQLYPFLELMGDSSRTELGRTVHWSGSANVWVNLLLPGFETVKESFGAFFQTHQGWARSFYPGLAVIVLGALAVGRKADRKAWILLFTGLFSLALASGENGVLYPLLHQVLPLDVMRYPVKFMIALSAVLPLLAAFGLTRIIRSEHRTWPLLVVLGLFLIATVLNRASARTSPDHAGMVIRQILYLALVAGLVISFTATNLKGREGWLVMGLLVIVWYDLRWHLPGMYQTISREAYTLEIPVERRVPPATETDFFRAGLSHKTRAALNFRHWPDPEEDVVRRRMHLDENLNLPAGVAKIGGFFSMWSFEKEEIAARLYPGDGTVNEPLADFIGLRHVQTMTAGIVSRTRPNAMPLVAGGQAPEFLDGYAAVERMIEPTFNPRENVILPSSLTNIFNASIISEPRIEDLVVTANRIRFKVTAETDSIITIAQCWSPNWGCYFSSQEVPIHRANHAFQAIVVTPGEHEVILTYSEPGFSFGLILSIGSLIALGVAWRRESIS
ncbi:MAG: YfhO family protein [Limisphaerales bacterium]